MGSGGRGNDDGGDIGDEATMNGCGVGISTVADWMSRRSCVYMGDESSFFCYRNSKKHVSGERAVLSVCCVLACGGGGFVDARQKYGTEKKYEIEIMT